MCETSPVCARPAELRGAVNHKPQDQFSLRVGFGVAQTPRKSCAAPCAGSSAGAQELPWGRKRPPGLGAPPLCVSGESRLQQLRAGGGKTFRIFVYSVKMTFCVCFKCSRK